MEWFKFYGVEYLSDPKMHALNACQRSCWVTLLSFASSAEDNGRIKHLTEPQLMRAAGIDPMKEEWSETEDVLNVFQNLGMIKIHADGVIEILNWKKRQQRYISNAERQRMYRERNRDVTSVTTRVVTPLQQSNARIEENRIEENRSTHFSKEKGKPNAKMLKNLERTKRNLREKKIIT